MSRSIRHKEKHGSRSELSQGNCNEGTAARTRPFNFDEIMLRRKNKKLSGDVEDTPGQARNTTVKDVVAKVFDCSDSGRGYRNDDSLSVVLKHSSEDFVKVSSRKKEGNTSMTEAKLVKRKDKEICDSETKSKVTVNKGAKGSKDERWGYARKTNDERSSGDYENEFEKICARDLVGKERYADRRRGKSEKETKRKHINQDDEISRGKNALKKHDSGKGHDSVISERKERKESSGFHNEESRSKKRRSRSRERDKDRSRRSVSLSPRSHKRTLYHVRKHGELSSHSSKDRSRRQQPDDDTNKISSNGSSNLHRRHGESTSGLGGYSPRKRRTEVAVKTPSPPPRSPEKRSAGWDLPPAAADINATSSVLSNVQSSNQSASSNTYGLSSVASVTSTTVRTLSGVFSKAAIDSIQLTQANRPMRRLYVENLPASASEKAVMESLNNFLLSSGVNRIQGSHPCISCIIHKEKGQALVEFITPEDASAALSFDGRSFSGSILKIRRPKDYVEVAVRMTGVHDKSVAPFDSISDIVRDSPHKYVDHSVTLNACTGLNGMRVGGQILTVVLATPDASSVKNTGSSPFYGIPEHAKPLLEKPTQVLKLKNVLDPEVLSSLSEPELEEVLEDIRLECARFGTVKSVNVVKYSDCYTILKKCEVLDETGSASDSQDLNCNKNTITEISGEHTYCDSQEISRPEPPNNDKTPEEVGKAAEGDSACGDKLTADLIEVEMCEPALLDRKLDLEIPTCKDNSNAISPELDDQLNLKDQMECRDIDKVDDNILAKDAGMENKPMVQEKLKPEEAIEKLMEEASTEMNSSVRMDSDALEKSETMEQVLNLENVFEQGCVLVEYRRTEAASAAAHCLHRRLFDNRIVTVGYIAYDIYKERFPK